jgi:hypothetical protein
MGDTSVTTKQATKTVRVVIFENRENGELEGILNRNRIAALNRLLRLAELKIGNRRKTKSAA